MINFSINKAYFLQALNTTKRAISSKNAIPIFLLEIVLLLHQMQFQSYPLLRLMSLLKGLLSLDQMDKSQSNTLFLLKMKMQAF